MRPTALWVVVALLLAGCGQARPEPEGPPLDDRGEFPTDVEAPAPDDDVFSDPAEELEPPDDEPYTVRGTILDPSGQPVAGASVWVEGADLRDPVNNLDVYRQSRDATLVTSGADGTYRMRLEGGFFSLYANHAGWLPQRSAPTEISEGTTYLNITLKPEAGPAVIAHRGASYYAPENTLAAIEKAAFLGANAVEIDVRITRDGELVAFHDHSLDRTSNGTGEVRNWTAGQLAALDAGAWFDESFRGERIPTLAQVFDAAEGHGVALILDVKSTAEDRERTWDAVLAAMAQRGGSQVTFAAFRQAAMRACVPTGLSCAHFMAVPATEDPVVRAVRLGVRHLMIDNDLFTADVAARSRAAGRDVSVWTLNEEDQWAAVLPLGPAGIVTDLPGRLLEFLNDHASVGE